MAKTRLEAYSWRVYTSLHSPYRSVSGRLARARWRGERGLNRLEGLRQWGSASGAVVRAFVLDVRAGLTRLLPSRREASAALASAAEAQMADALEHMQRAYFAYPWLGFATISAASRVGTVLSVLTRLCLRVVLATRCGRIQANRDRLARIPTDGYQAFMAAWLVATEAAGVFRAGDVHVNRVNLSDRSDMLHVQRRSAPVCLADSLRDIDDMLYASCPGAVIKIIDVAGTRPWHSRFTDLVSARESRRRWIIEIPGTNHLSMATTPNPADPQANMLESIGLASNPRRGVLEAIVRAMRESGLSEEDMAHQEVLMVGHSQGAMIALALAADPDTPFPVTAIVSAGGPIGRMPVSEGTTVVALRHLQDPIPLFGGLAGEVDPKVLVFERSLRAPESGVLYYAHAAYTYSLTAEAAEEYRQTVPDSPVSRALERIAAFYPQETRWSREGAEVSFYEIYQDVLPVRKEGPRGWRRRPPWRA